ncbi:MAG: PaaI family thioesterase [Pseudohongiella sp.]|nr:PaaI family thioesterase [Pseudohongiella sp.]MDO9520203.1 PaaI family thioesterase [Pseudohongiella sp.]MDP2125924.1 PaaI family thioesterase [Pseudohongiella sp.]
MGSADNKPIFMRPGHCAGDLLEAPDWHVIEESEGLVLIDAHIPTQVLNPRQQLFGGFTGTYVDMLAIYTLRTLFPDRQNYWVTTINMRIDYLEPVLGPRVRLKGELINQGRSTALIAVTFFDEAGTKLVYALVTLKVIDKKQER